MAFQFVGGGEFHPESWASFIQDQLLPGIAQDRWEGWQVMRGRAESTDEHARALMEAARTLEPPEKLGGAAETYATLMLMLAFRANSGDFIQIVDVGERYERAVGWFCDNFREIIWWNCD